MSIFRWHKKPHHYEFRVEKYWDIYSGEECYRLIRYNFDKKDKLVKGEEYNWLGSGNKSWAGRQMRHYSITAITPPLFEDLEEE